MSDPSNTQTAVQIGARRICEGERPYVVAELSANHQGRLEHALELVDAAAECGADAIKLQTYRADTITLDSDRAEFKIDRGPRAGMTLFELYQRASTPWEWHEAIFRHAGERGLAAFSAPFDLTAVDFLEALECPAYKIASFEIVDIALVRKVARTGKPVVISTGMADLSEVSEAVAACLDAGNDRIVVLHCVSGYPTPVEDSNLLTLERLREATGCVVGLSDHTLTTTTSVAAVALGASLVEKHFILSRDEGGFDAAFSLEPAEMKTLVTDVRDAWQALGKVDFSLKPSEVYPSRLRRSLYVVRDVRRGERLASDDVRSVRPNNGLAPKYLDQVLGRVAAVDIAADTPLSWDLLRDEHSP